MTDTFGKHHLANFADSFSKRRFRGSTVRGLQAIQVSRIIGSVNRSLDYYYDFTKISEGDRTREIERMMSRGDSLPPIDVFQVGQYYYVEDGHHRVAIAKRLKQEFIDAYVTQYFFWTYEEYFHGKLGLTDVVCSRPSYYKRLLDDIRDLRAQRYGESYVDFRQVADEWHRDVFLPGLEKIAACGLRGLGRKSTADHYCRYLRLKCTPQFRDRSMDDVLAYLVKRYTSPMYALDRLGGAVLRGLTSLCKRLLKQGPADEVNPTA